MNTLLILIALLFIIECCFRLWHFSTFGKSFHVWPKWPWKESYVVAHPFLSFAYRRNSSIERNQRLPYPLHPNVYRSFHKPLRINNEGHFGEDFSLRRKPNELRIACLGASTTANTIADDEREYSYPALLQNELEARLAKDSYTVNVMNCGIGGWCAPDIVSNYLLNIVPYQPDYIILYHGFNDLLVHHTPGFVNDYSHARKNLGEVISDIRFAYLLPQLSFLKSYEWVKTKLFGTGNVRNDVLYAIRRAAPDMNSPMKEPRQVQELFRSLIASATYRGTKVITSSFAFYPYQETKEYKVLQKGVEVENELMEELADEFNIQHVDQAKLIPHSSKYFVDSVHFTPEGMRRIANNFAECVVTDLEQSIVSHKITS